MLRGINRQDIFEDDEDYRLFIKILSGLYSRPSEDLTTTICACHIFAYCLMPNHVHLLLREKEWHIGDIMKSIASSYVTEKDNCRSDGMSKDRPTSDVKSIRIKL